MSLDSHKEKSPPNPRMVPNASSPLEMTSSKAFRCVQAWLQEKPAVWADDPCLAAQMAQRPPAKRPREDALLEAERSHQRRRIELLKEQLRAADLDARRLARKLEDTEPAAAIEEEAGQIFTALRTPATRSQRAELALRWFEAGITWRARWGDDDEGPQPNAEELISEWQAELSETLWRRRGTRRVKKEVGAWGLSVASAGGIAPPTPAVRELSFRGLF